MISQSVMEAFTHFVPAENIKPMEPMKHHTTFRVGGAAECFIEVESEEALLKLQNYLNILEIPYFLLGNGSNLLVSDKGYKGVVLHFQGEMESISVFGNRIVAKAGARMSAIARKALEHGLTGFEFASGIPGTIGGGVVMNAGAYGGELSQVVKRVVAYNEQCEQLILDNQSMKFGYRSSALQRHRFLVTEVELELQQGNPESIRATMEELSAKRREKQPLEYPSAGSTFKRPEGYFAGELIMKAGLAGFSIGGAQVSEKHCGFIINQGAATAADIYCLIQKVKERVKEQHQVDLEPEVLFLGDFK